eukprot:2498980-Lingulodinium_polyedra.AAC.1
MECAACDLRAAESWTQARHCAACETLRNNALESTFRRCGGSQSARSRAPCADRFSVSASSARACHPRA